MLTDDRDLSPDEEAYVESLSLQTNIVSIVDFAGMPTDPYADLAQIGQFCEPDIF